jgi:hypothetical protein
MVQLLIFKTRQSDCLLAFVSVLGTQSAQQALLTELAVLDNACRFVCVQLLRTIGR